MIDANLALQRHKDWLNIFKLRMNLVREDEEERQKHEAEKFELVKEIGARDRVRSKKMKEEFDNANSLIANTLGGGS